MEFSFSILIFIPVLCLIPDGFLLIIFLSQNLLSGLESSVEGPTTKLGVSESPYGQKVVV